VPISTTASLGQSSSDAQMASSLRGDVRAAAAAGVRPQRRPGPQQPAADARATALEAVEQVAIAHQQPYQADQIVAAPPTTDIRLARTDRAAHRERSIERRILHAHVHGGESRIARMSEGHTPARVLHHESPVTQRTQALDQLRT
jgi:hypothetical protein